MNVKIEYKNYKLCICIMIIPIKCFTCGTLIADKYRLYVEEVSAEKEKKGITEPVYFNASNTTKTIEGVMMDKLGLTKPCCRRHMLTHVDIE
jgi:DNA-directed RNA polymerase subunit N (RpoN/RPB10)